MVIKRLLMADEVADLFKVDKQRVYDMVRRKHLPAIRLGERQYRFDADVIEEWINNGGAKLEDKNDEQK